MSCSGGPGSLHEPLHEDRCRSHPTHGIRPLLSTLGAAGDPKGMAMVVRVGSPNGVHACVPISEFGCPWPQGVPLQVHAMDADELLVVEGDLDLPQTCRGDRERRACSCTPAIDTCSLTAACPPTT